MSDYTKQKVEEKARQSFTPADLPGVLQTLETYGVESHERERERVQLGILKLSGGDLVKLRELVEVAKRDYRDILAWAEYPREMSRSPTEMQENINGEAGRIRERDRAQYLEWLLGRNDDGEGAG